VPPAEANAERRAAEADQFRSEGDAAAEQMGGELTAAQARTTTATEADRGAAVAKIRADAEARIAAAGAERDAAVAKARADATAREAQQDTARAEAAATAVQAETERVRAHSGRTLAQDASPPRARGTARRPPRQS
jgi:colicin import membrane protein